MSGYEMEFPLFFFLSMSLHILKIHSGELEAFWRIFKGMKSAAEFHFHSIRLPLPTHKVIFSVSSPNVYNAGILAIIFLCFQIPFTKQPNYTYFWNFQNLLWNNTNWRQQQILVYSTFGKDFNNICISWFHSCPINQ